MEELVRIVRGLGPRASFSRILLESRARGVILHDRTLRRYLDLLVEGRVLTLRQRDVGSVHPKQLYKVRSAKATVYAGLLALQAYGLNWDVPPDELHRIETDLTGLARSKRLLIGSRTFLCASFEDCIVNEVLSDSYGTGGGQLALAMLAVKPCDLPYLLSRADDARIGMTVRAMLRRIVQIYTGKVSIGDGRLFIATRDRVLRLFRQYSKHGVLDLLKERGRGDMGEAASRTIPAETIVSSIGKQLGISG